MDEHSEYLFNDAMRTVKANPELEKRFNALTKKQQDSALSHYMNCMDMWGDEKALPFVIKLQEGYAQGKSYMDQLNEYVAGLKNKTS
jgi:hypothetical protein